MDLQGYYPADVRRGIFKGVDLVALAERFWALDAMRADGRPLPTITWRSRSRSHCGGTAWPGNGAQHSHRITMRLGPSTIEDAAEVLLHELVHCACPIAEHHGKLFRRRLIACAREAFGLPLDVALLMSVGPEGHKCSAYAIDRHIRRSMEDMRVGHQLRERAPAPPPPPSPEVSPEIIERARIEARRIANETRIAIRAAHAQTMLEVWNKRLKTAQRRRAMWAKKVRYYEKKAAKS